MPKIVIETGNGSHSSSHGRLQAKVVGGERDGKFLYECKDWKITDQWDKSKMNEKWVTTAYEMPNGTQIQITGSGATGARGAKKHTFNRIYQVDVPADVLDTLVDVGIRDCTLKGRLRLVKDLEAVKAAQQEDVFNEDF